MVPVGGHEAEARQGTQMVAVRETDKLSKLKGPTV